VYPRCRRKLRSFRLPSLGAALFLAACGSNPSGDSSNSGSGGAQPHDLPELVRLDFARKDEFELNPRQVIEIEVEVEPHGAREVSFALLSAPGVEHDGVLDRSSTLSDAEGLARVSLTAPSTPVKLSLRAGSGSVFVYAQITVTARGTTAITVVPRYAGPREVTQWVASVHVGKGCEDLTGVPIDGDWVGVSSTDEVEVRDVPVGQPLAVTLRAGRFLNGCADEEGVSEGPATRVVVPLSAVPLNLGSSVLDVTIGLEPGDPTLEAALESGRAVAALALRSSADEAPAAASDVAALLDAMQSELVPTQSEAFASARAAENWDAEVAEALGDPQGTRLTDALLRWSTIGSSALLSPHAFEGRLQSSANLAGHASLTIDRAAGAAAAELGVSAEPISTWEADGTDKLAFGGALSWMPSKLAAGLAIAPALAETGAESLDAALQQLYECPVVARAIADSSSLAGCDTECLETLCSSGMSALWDKVQNFSGATSERLELTAVGDATVGEDAEAVALVATWVGRLASAPGTILGGRLNGWAPSVTAR
jgi:hypothetical protein